MWGELFAGDWSDLSAGMSERAKAIGLIQEESEDIFIWKRGSKEECRWVFINDPSDIESVRAIFLSDENIKSPNCFIVVKQPDPTDSRGDIIFDIFRMNRKSYLWHFNRVYTKPKKNKS
jgi:hypothetical protein